MNSDVYSLNDETPEEVIDYKVRTPWRMVASMAGVIGTNGIISADYEYVANDNIRVEDNVGELDYTTEDIKNYLQPSHIIRLGGEYRINPSWSLRAGYSYQTSSTKDEVQDDQVDVYVSGSSAAYTYDRSTQNITCGFGYHYKNVYFDMAYVHKYAQNNYHLFPGINDLPTVKDKVNFHNNRISATIGFRF